MPQNDKLQELIDDAVWRHPEQELALGWLRYEALRRLKPSQFADLHKRTIKGEWFDDIVTEELIRWKTEL